MEAQGKEKGKEKEEEKKNNKMKTLMIFYIQQKIIFEKLFIII